MRKRQGGREGKGEVESVGRVTRRVFTNFCAEQLFRQGHACARPLCVPICLVEYETRGLASVCTSALKETNCCPCCPPMPFCCTGSPALVSCQILSFSLLQRTSFFRAVCECVHCPSGFLLLRNFCSEQNEAQHLCMRHRQSLR